MQEILLDITKADALAQQLVKHDSSKSIDTEFAKLKTHVLLIHHTTQEQFEKSYSYYTHHPDILKVMFDSLSAQQTRKAAALQTPSIEPSLLRKRYFKDTPRNKKLTDE
ncbi:MAG: DUF4296 domain-containing protein [Bacteroidota bacterium]|nr:DUF4296 domain-containing protein [Bacteroidota bacterium]